VNAGIDAAVNVAGKGRGGKRQAQAHPEQDMQHVDELERRRSNR
jgi:hypothetical protein